MGIAACGFAFYAAQKQNEAAYFLHLQKRQQEKAAQQEQVYKERMAELNQATQTLNAQIKAITGEIEGGRRDAHELQAKYNEKLRFVSWRNMASRQQE